jgi:hypothetical protein
VAKKNPRVYNKFSIAKMESWHELLLSNLAKRNRNISEDELELAAKRTLAIIIFLQTRKGQTIGENFQYVLYPRENDEIIECEPLAVQRNRLNWERLNRTVQQRLFRLFDYVCRWNSTQFSSFLKSHKIKIPETAFDDVNTKLKLDDRILREIIEEIVHLHDLR